MVSPAIDLQTLNDEQLAKLGLLAGPINRDDSGRILITWGQYQMIAARGDRLDHFCLQMNGPGGTGRVQASKLQKWWGLGYRPVGWTEPEPQPAAPAPAAPAPAPTVYYCRDRFPDCPRFFDSEEARLAHQRSAHKGGR